MALKEKNEPADKKDAPKKKSNAPTYRLISLLGLLGTRNFIVALRLYKAVHKKFPEEEKGKWNFSPGEYLKKSLEVEEFCQMNKIQYGETAFAAAYLFDWMIAMAKQHQDQKQLLAYIDQQWRLSFRAGLVAYGIAQRYPNFPFLKFAMAGGIAHNAGRVLMAMSFQNYLELQGKLEKIPKFPLLPEEILEEKQFGIGYAELSALAVRFFSVLKPIELPVRYQLEPYYLKERDRNLYLFAAVLQLATTMAVEWHIPTGDKDPLLKHFKKPWAKELRLDDRKLSDIMKWAMTLKS